MIFIQRLPAGIQRSVLTIGIQTYQRLLPDSLSQQGAHLQRGEQPVGALIGRIVQFKAAGRGVFVRAGHGQGKHMVAVAGWGGAQHRRQRTALGTQGRMGQ